ncbi:RNA ligase [Kitasatospora sp. NPDC050543]|uniref:RNA ligase n=1 Tax=Kitasatospora sp. NPDC050543 TaxID=3364054 RepID=UPI00378AC758
MTTSTSTAAQLTLDDLFPADDLRAAVEAGHVSRRKHPSLPLSIFSYTRACQYEGVWTPVTTRCRGLVADDSTGRIVGHCLPKFFNLSEHIGGRPYAPPLPDEPFEVYDKLDGSLGIVFQHSGGWHVASKGSFISEQAQWAQRRLDSSDTGALRPGHTYLVEILYPENRIVVDYGARRDLVLLAAYRADGSELPLDTAAPDWAGLGSVVRRWPAPPLKELRELTEGNVLLDGAATSGMDAEGYVVRFASGVRVKAKTSEYVRLHKVLTGINERDVWQAAGLERFAGREVKAVAQAVGVSPAEATEKTAGTAAGRGPLAVMLEDVPDEFDQWVRRVTADLQARYDELHGTIGAAYDDIAGLRGDRAAFARAAQRHTDRTVRAAMFLLLDERPVDLLIWRVIKPAATDPFKTDEDA